MAIALPVVRQIAGVARLTTRTVAIIIRALIVRIRIVLAELFEFVVVVIVGVIIAAAAGKNEEYSAQHRR